MIRNFVGVRVKAIEGKFNQLINPHGARKFTHTHQHKIATTTPTIEPWSINLLTWVYFFFIEFQFRTPTTNRNILQCWTYKTGELFPVIWFIQRLAFERVNLNVQSLNFGSEIKRFDTFLMALLVPCSALVQCIRIRTGFSSVTITDTKYILYILNQNVVTKRVTVLSFSVSNFIAFK